MRFRMDSLDPHFCVCLQAGAAIVARCAHGEHGEVAARVRALDFLPPEGEAWARLPVEWASLPEPAPELSPRETAAPGAHARPVSALPPGHGDGGGVPDIEDCWAAHARAVSEGQQSYIDPKTGHSAGAGQRKAKGHRGGRPRRRRRHPASHTRHRHTTTAPHT